MSDQNIHTLAHRSLEKLRQYIETENFKGYDPYDALNSPLLRLLSFNSKCLRILFTQTLKRFPINLRPYIGIKKELNPKALGLFLWGYAKLYAVEKKEAYLETIAEILELLEAANSKGYAGYCWGYNFDWQSRAFFVPKYMPTIVNSAFVGHALIDTCRYTGIQRTLDMALSVRDFILSDLNRTTESGTICFSYTPIDNTAVHNANLLGASLLIRTYQHAPDEALKEAALSALAYSMKYQHPEGSWYYAETDYQRWIDSFHTGFNLQSIHYFLEEGFGEEYTAQFLKGVEFYQSNFFMKDGTPKYYHDKLYPIDIHSPAQAVVLFSKMGQAYVDLAELLLRWMIANTQDTTGFFHFQKTKTYTNKIPYIRWSQAWAFHALTSFVSSNS